MIIIYEEGDPVKLKSRRGLYRFVEYRNEVKQAEVIGPVASPISRVVPVGELVPAWNAKPGDVAAHPGLRDMSAAAHRRMGGVR